MKVEIHLLFLLYRKFLKSSEMVYNEPVERVHYVATDEAVREYYSIDLDDGSHLKGLIEKIVLGPNASTDSHIFERYLHKLSSENSIDITEIEIENSESPLR